MRARAAQVSIRGVVQGVGFRYFVYRRANDMGLTGWARNRPDGSVEVYIEGDHSVINAMIDELRIGPPAASVTDVAVSWREPTGGYQSFDISH